MKPYEIINADCVAAMSLVIEPGSVDAIVTDPPYELGFMGKGWDSTGIANSPAMWRAAFDCLKPGGHLLAFSGTRTYHRMVCAIEDAGFEVRDQIGWVYGSGFPKSLDVSKAIGKAAGAAREVVGSNPNYRDPAANAAHHERWNGASMSPDITAPATDAARQWQGWGTALKPAWEPIVVARKPLIGTVAANVLAHGTGALNIDGCRVPGEKPLRCAIDSDARNNPILHTRSATGTGETTTEGRWPANIIHDGSDEVLAAFPGDEQRFFYCAKASKSDRGEGNVHPTVKPTDLMRYLCRLVTPPGGLILDPFTGSGSTGKAAVLEGFRFIGCELSDEYVRIAEARIATAYASTMRAAA